MKEIMIVTGGTSGLGLELVKQGLERKMFVCNIGRNKEKLVELNQVFTENYRGFCGDVSDEDFMIDAIDEIKKLGEIKVLINNAEKGIFKMPTEYTKSDVETSFKGLQGMIIASTRSAKSNAGKRLENRKHHVICGFAWK